MQFKIIAATLTSVLAIGAAALPAAAPEAAPDALAAPEAAPEPVEHAPLEARSELGDLATAQHAYIQAANAYAAKAAEFKKNGGMEKLQKEHQNNIQARGEQAKQNTQWGWPGAGGFVNGGAGAYANQYSNVNGNRVGLDLLGIPILGLSNTNFNAGQNSGANAFYNYGYGF